METWRPVPIACYARTYEVSNHGRVRNIRLPESLTPRDVPRILSPQIHQGYERVGLRRKGASNRQWLFVHQLVARAFIGPPPKYRIVNHKDRNKRNNRTGNLEYVSRAENSRHAAAGGYHTSTKGKKQTRLQRMLADWKSATAETRAAFLAAIL